MRWLVRHTVLVSAIVYITLGTGLFVYTERTFPIGVPRLLLTVAIVYGFPLVVALTWILSGWSIRGRLRVAGMIAVPVIAVLWLINTPRLGQTREEPYFIAHQGVHQVMNPEHNRIDQCLGRIYPSEHDYIENTVPSIQAAFDLGARYVEIDIRPTQDGHFVVFHDDTLDCKTEATGLVREHTLAELQTLDVGYGYFTEAADHPLRGKGVGMMRSLHEVLDTFPGKGIYIDVKFGNNRALWESLIDYIAVRPADDLRRIVVHGVPRGVELVRQTLPDVSISSYERAFRCVRNYILTGWIGYVPSVCNRSVAGTYADTGWLFWGWPEKYVARMERSETVLIMRPRGQSEQDFAASIPTRYVGGILTDRIESIRDWMASD